MTKKEAETLKSVDPRLQEQAAEIWRIERVMRKKIKTLLPLFDELSVAQTVTSTQGEQVLKPNPALAEIRAIFRDYCAVVKEQTAILGGKAPAAAEISELDSIRAKLKLVK